ncbi:MAG: hypothetical protein QOJ59_5417, partial [Thermomicrobiales bacterium]|nr:hypothetical protein [Thermomicrobiales bacterium]
TQLEVNRSPVSADGFTWYSVSGEYGTGWCAGEFLTGGGFSPGDDVHVVDGVLNLRSGPGTGRSIVAVMADGASLTVTDGPRNADGYAWYEVTGNRYGDGWCVGQYLERD